MLSNLALMFQVLLIKIRILLYTTYITLRQGKGGSLRHLGISQWPQNTTDPLHISIQYHVILLLLRFLMTSLA